MLSKMSSSTTKQKKMRNPLSHRFVYVKKNVQFWLSPVAAAAVAVAQPKNRNKNAEIMMHSIRRKTYSIHSFGSTKWRKLFYSFGICGLSCDRENLAKKKKKNLLFEYFQSHYYTYARFYVSRRHICFFFFSFFTFCFGWLCRACDRQRAMDWLNHCFSRRRKWTAFLFIFFFFFSHFVCFVSVEMPKRAPFIYCFYVSATNNTRTHLAVKNSVTKCCDGAAVKWKCALRTHIYMQ